MHKVFLTMALAGTMIAVAACEREQTEQQQSAPATATETGSEQPEAAVEQRHTIRGRVTAINQEAAEVTIDHEPVESLNWPAMIMPFPVRDASMLDGISVGDRVTFLVTENESGEYVIEEIRQDEAP